MLLAARRIKQCRPNPSLLEITEFLLWTIFTRAQHKGITGPSKSKCNPACTCTVFIAYLHTGLVFHRRHSLFIELIRILKFRLHGFLHTKQLSRKRCFNLKYSVITYQLLSCIERIAYYIPDSHRRYETSSQLCCVSEGKGFYRYWCQSMCSILSYF